MKQHYMPVFYLKGFTDPSIRIPKKSYLWEFRFDRGTWEKSRPRGIAWASNFYAWLDRDGTQHNYVDEALKKVETWVAPTIRRLISGRDSELNEVDVVNIATFVSTMVGRAPGPIEALVDFIEGTESTRLKLVCERLKGNPAELERAILRANVSRAEITADTLNPERYRVNVNCAAVAASTLQTASRFYPVFLEKSWLFLQSAAPDYFVVSDNPFFLNTETMEATIPFSRTLCLVLSHTRCPERGRKTIRFRKAASADEVESINARTSERAAYFIAAPTLDFPGAAFLKGKAPR